MSDASRWSLVDLSAHVVGCWGGDRDSAAKPGAPDIPDESATDGVVLVSLPDGTTGTDRNGHRFVLEQPVIQGWTFTHSPWLLGLIHDGREDAVETITVRVDARSAPEARRYADRQLAVIALTSVAFTDLPDEVKNGLLGRIQGGWWSPPFHLDGLPYFL